MKISIKGIKGKDFVIDPEDSLAMKLSMLIAYSRQFGQSVPLKADSQS